MKILIIEDEAQLAEMMKAALMMDGDHAIECASDGKEGLERFFASKGNYDVVVTDYRMPIMNGLGVIKKIREVSSVRIVVQSSDVSDESIRRELKKAGADQMLAKPWQTHEFVDAVVGLPLFAAK